MSIYRGTGSASTTTDQATIDEVTTQATNAANSATSAASSASSAASSASSASSSASTATSQASAASTSATNAASSASAASTSASNAATSATNAATSATTAASEATNAETAETGAVAARASAESAQTAAETAKDLAEGFKDLAASSASSASSSASTATTKAGEALASANSASDAQTAAEAAQAAAEAAQAAIDGTYLGALASNPTGDGNGDDVTVGDWYFNTTSNQAYIYNGSTWDALAPDLIGDATPQLGGNLDTNGNDITFGDNDKAIFGAGSDLQIFHDGTNSRIDDAGSGRLIIRGNGGVSLEKYTGETMAVFNADGASNLYYDNSAKLATTNTGIDVTGTVTADENITIDTSSSGNGLTIQSSGNTYNRLTFDANRSASGNLLGEIMGEWNGTQVAAIRVSAGSDTTNKDDGQIYFLTSSDGTGNKNRVNIANNGDISFYEDTGATAKFFWDASAESLGIGTTSPSQKLHLVQSGSTEVITRTVNDNGFLDVGVKSGGNSYINADGAQKTLVFEIDTSEAMRIDSSGNVGIGTSSPDAPLTVQGGSATSATIQLKGGALANDNASIHSLYNLYLKADSSESIANRNIIFQVGSTDAMRIDSSGNVGIGVTPSEKLEVYGTTPRFQINDRGLYQAQLALIGNDLEIRGSSGQIEFYQGNADGASSTNQSMTLDANGNLLVGTTNNGSTLIAATSGGGINIDPDGYTAWNRQAVSSNQAHIVFNQTGVDAKYFEFRKDGAPVGSIGVDSGTRLFFTNSSGAGLFLSSGTQVEPMNNGSRADDTMNLGGATYRFKDLYLSGGIKAGSNKLLNFDDTGNGRVRIGTDGSTPTGITAFIRGSASATTSYFLWNRSDTATTGTAAVFQNANTTVGTIQYNNSSTSYNTSSDYRLKENVVDMTGAVDRVKALNPSQFNFITDPDKTVDGFLAHEVADVVPEAVTGTKDAMQTEEYEITPAVLDDDGNVVTEAVMGTREVPDYQGIDQSKLVPLLTGALQEAIARIETLEAEVATLKGN